MARIKALRTFSISHQGIRLQVRLLARLADVDALYRGGKRRNTREITHGFFQPRRSATAQHHGLIVLALECNLDEIVPHEVGHAVVHCMQGVSASNDEAAATAIGMLSSKIFAIARPLAARISD